MAGENTLSNLNSNFRIVYGDNLTYLKDDNNWAYNNFRWKSSKKLGNYFRQPVVLKQEQGFTYAKSNHSIAGGTETLTATVNGLLGAVPGKIEAAVLQGSQLFLRSLIDYETAAKGASSKAAFVETVGHVYESMWLQMQRRLNSACLWGQSDTFLGKVSAFASNVITVTDATWAPGIWAGEEGAEIEWGTATDITGAGTITSVNLKDKKITISATLLGTAPASPAANDFLTFRTERFPTNASGVTDFTGTNAPNHQNFVGLARLLTRQAASVKTLDIENDAYSLWQPEEVDVGSTNLSLEAVEDMAAKLKVKGASAEQTLLISPLTFSKLITDFAGLRRFQKDDGSRYTIGAEEIKIFAGGLKVMIVADACMKEGEAYIFNKSDFFRVGATDITWKVPGRGEDLFILTTGSPTFEIQNYSHQALFCDKIGRGGRFINIVNS